MTIGLSNAGIGLVAKDYDLKNPDGMIVSINQEVQRFLVGRDCFILEDCDVVLETCLHGLGN